jgi:uncharacterized membrane protein
VYPEPSEVVPERILKKLPPKERQQLTAIVEQHSGPIPSAKAMQQYEAVLPGAADRIISMAEKEQELRKEFTSIMAPADIRQSKTAQHYAFVFLMTMGGGGIWLCAAGNPIVGGLAICLAGVAALGNYFKRGSH